MKKGKRIAAVLLALVLAASSVLVFHVSAATSGKCGANLTWSLNGGTLTISGSGSMYDYGTHAPWTDYLESITAVNIQNGVTTIGNGAFYGCVKLTKISIPDSVKTIGNDAFYCCRVLKNTTIPKGVVTIGRGAFSGCWELNNILLPSELKNLGGGAFRVCNKLTTITIPNGVTKIEGSTFADCGALKTITIPASVTSIEDYAFHNDWNLTDVYYGGTKQQLGIWDEGNEPLAAATFHYNSAAPAGSSASNTAVASVSGLKATYTDTTVTLSWNKVSGATGYIVYRYDATTQKYVDVGRTAYNTFLANGLAKGMTQKFAVRAYKTVGGQTYSSNYVYLTTSTVPATVSYTLTSTTNSVKVNWTKVAGATGYLVYYRTNTGESWTKLADSTGTTYTKTGLTPGKSYIFTVKAYRKVDGVIYNAAHSPKTVSTLPATVSYTLTSTANSVKVTWTKVTGATGYLVYYRTNTSESWTKLADSTGTTYTKTGLTPGKSYIFTVKAYRKVDGVTYNAAHSPKTVSTCPATVNYTLTTSGGSVKVAWTKVAGATGYLVYYRTNTSESWTKLTDSTGTSFTKTGLTKGKSYIFTVKAYRKVDGVTYNAAHSPKTITVK